MEHQIIDITRPVGPGIAVWPGDQPYVPGWSARIDEGSSVNVGMVTLSTHTGTHADAPLHYTRTGQAIDELPLEAFIGDAFVIDVGAVPLIGAEHVDGVDVARFPRLLFRTPHGEVPAETWSDAFPAFDPALIDRLGRQGVRLVGTDAPSVDPADSTELPAHHALARNRILNLENLDLRDVAPGPYRLVALPMKLVGLDAAPVRAVLMRYG